MKKSFLIIAWLLANHLALAQTAILYQQDFGTINGGSTLADVGWSQVLPPAGYSGMYNQAGAVDGVTAQSLPVRTLYFGGNAGRGIFFTTNGAGSGTGGDSAFTSINPTLYTNLNISIESQWSFNGGNLKCWFAVQVGGNWYINTNVLITTLQHSAGAIFYNSSITYNPAATNWNVLTNTTVVGIGPQAGTDLSGTIDGIGVVTVLTGSGSWNYNNFLITSISNTVSQPPTLSAAPISQANYAGGGVSFAVSATGTAPLKYIWQKDGVTLTNNTQISGATNSIITIQNISAVDVGNYSVIVSNSAGFFDSSTNSTASLTVNSLPVDYLYAETFPFVGASLIGYPLGVVGWSNAIPDGPNRLFQNTGGDAAFYNFQGSALTNAFYVTTNSDTGASGLKFPKITPASYPAVSFSVDIAPSYQPANLAGYFAVRMSGGNWFVSSTPIPVNTSTATGTYTTYQQQFNPLAANWNNLTLSGTDATIGNAASSNLTGDIIGAGLVFAFSGAGNFNIDNFLVVTDSVAATPPTITALPLSQTVFDGAGVSFAGTATGSQPLSYFWQKDGNPLTNGGNISGVNSNVLTVLNVNGNSAGQYSLIVSNSAGTDTSANYLTTILTVNDRPTNLLYSESFPFVGPVAGNYPVGVVGWAAAVPDTSSRLYQNGGGDGAVYNYQAAASTTAFYATTASDPGASGLPFPSLNIAGASGLAFAVDIAPTVPIGVTASLAVQINNSSWYISATNLPVDTNTASGAYTTFSQNFSPTAANWNNLTITGTGATVGSAAGANLSGNITGAGLVFNFSSAGGNFNFDNFQVTGSVVANPGSISIGTMTTTTLTLNWTAGPNVHLQSATNLTPPSIWLDVAGTTNASSATVSKTGSQMFFRLISQ